MRKNGHPVWGSNTGREARTFKSTKLYDRTADDITLDDVERSGI